MQVDKQARANACTMTDAMMDAAQRYLDERSMSSFQLPASFNWHEFYSAIEAAKAAPDGAVASGVEAFQERVAPWMLACFGAEISGDVIERNHRFLEEALELVQSTGCTAGEAHQLVDYVYGREVGDPPQEVGGVMVTLAALCLATGMDMHSAAEDELARIWTKVEKIRAKQAAKPKHSPLPQHTTPAPTPSAPGGVADGWVLVPREPTPELLMSMAIRYDHGLGMPGYYDQELFSQSGITHARRLESALTTMRQLHEEVVGTGFYRAPALAPQSSAAPAWPAGEAAALLDTLEGHLKSVQAALEKAVATITRQAVEIDHLQSLTTPSAPAGPGVAEPWSDIGTAPKDGTVIDLWAQSLGPASRDTDEMRVYVEFRVPAARWFAGAWANEDGNSLDLDEWENLVFTHWMPLPKPPAPSAAPAPQRDAT